jgi:hypothetical protein
LSDQSIFEKFGMRERIADISPDRLDFLTKVFEIVCEIYSIPVGARNEREALALEIIWPIGPFQIAESCLRRRARPRKVI